MSSKPNIYSRLRSAIRREWLYSELRKNTMTQARVSRGIYRCGQCKALVGPKLIEIDHKIKATPEGGIQDPKDFGVFIERLLFCGPDGVVALCKPCHQVKTQSERGRSKKKVSRSTGLIVLYAYYNYRFDFILCSSIKVPTKTMKKLSYIYLGLL